MVVLCLEIECQALGHKIIEEVPLLAVPVFAEKLVAKLSFRLVGVVEIVGKGYLELAVAGASVVAVDGVVGGDVEFRLLVSAQRKASYALSVDDVIIRWLEGK